MNQNSLSFYFGILCIFCSSKIFIAVYIIITDYLQEREKSPCIPGLLSTSYLIIHHSACEFDLHTTIQDPSQRHKRDPRSTTFLPHLTVHLQNIAPICPPLPYVLNVSLALLMEGKATDFQSVSILIGSSPPASSTSYLK